MVSSIQLRIFNYSKITNMKAILITFLGLGLIVMASSFEDVQPENNISKCSVSKDPIPERMDRYEPVLYWGATPSGGSAYRNEIRIYALYPPDVPISGMFKVISMEFTIQGEGRIFSVSGDTMTDDFLDLLRRTPSGYLVHCSARVKDEGGIVNMIKGSWELR